MRAEEDRFDALSDPDTGSLVRLIGAALGIAGALTLAVNALSHGGVRPTSLVAVAAGAIIHTLARRGRLRRARLRLRRRLAGARRRLGRGGLRRTRRRLGGARRRRLRRRLLTAPPLRPRRRSFPHAPRASRRRMA